LHEAARVPVPPSLSAVAQNAKNEQQRLELIARIRQSLGDLPVLQGSKGIEVGVRAMCQVLDPYCQPVALKEGFQVLREKPISPFGLDWEMPAGASTAVITKVDPGGPAQRNGLRPGDRITHVNGRPANEQATLLLPPATDSPAPDRAAEEVVLTLVRPATKLTRTVTLPAEDFRPESVFGVVRQEDNSWDFMVDREHQIAQVRIGSIAEGTAEELQQALTALKVRGLRGLILDLRWCPGGFLKEAVASARLFLDEVPIAKTKMRNGQSEEYVGKRDVNFLDFPIIVLVNHDTLGGAELIAAALQDNKRALVAGQRTFGKGTIQILTVVVTPNIGLKLSARQQSD
jgi:carboxyl-terminal processing protease